MKFATEGREAASWKGPPEMVRSPADAGRRLGLPVTFQPALTIATEPDALPVGIGDRVGEEHDAVARLAVTEAQNVAAFVNGFL